MNHDQLKNLAVKYRIDDLPESSMPGTFLSNVINRLELAPDYIPEVTINYLRKTSLKSLLKYACKQISFSEYIEVTKSEQNERRLVAGHIKNEQERQAAIAAEYKEDNKKLINY
jgi:hypothetical protein